MSRALLVVPPLVKYTAGPLLGPAMLVGAARDAGHQAEVLDLNIAFIRASGVPLDGAGSALTGDHDKPREALRRVDALFREQLGLTGEASGRVADPIGSAAFSLELVQQSAERVLESFGASICEALAKQAEPEVVGLSVLFGGQVYWALAITQAVKEVWPRAVVVWGGAHVTAIQACLSELLRAAPSIDGFVVGHAERTFVELLDRLADPARWPASVMRRERQGALVRAEGDAPVMPLFDAVALYDRGRLTLPVQMSRGCSYGRCSFCTYPAIEGRYDPVSAHLLQRHVVQARALGAALSFKDSLVDGQRLTDFAAVINRRVRWSACTKLAPSLSWRLRELGERGCDTLEVGLETIVGSSQLSIDTRQSWQVVERTREASTSAGIALIVNYMTGFVNEDPVEARAGVERVAHALRQSGNRGRLEVNEFQLERLAPEAGRGHLRITRTWPWASVCDWEPIERRRLHALVG